MKKQWIKKLNENQYWIFILGLYATIQIIKDMVIMINDFINMNISKIKDLPIFSFEFFGNLLQIITVYVLYRVYQNYKKLKEEMKERYKEIVIMEIVLKVRQNKVYSMQMTRDVVNSIKKERDEVKKELENIFNNIDEINEILYKYIPKHELEDGFVE